MYNVQPNRLKHVSPKNYTPHWTFLRDNFWNKNDPSDKFDYFFRNKIVFCTYFLVLRNWVL